MRHSLIAGLFSALAATASCQSAPEKAPGPAPVTLAGVTLAGVLSRADHQTYRELPFTVPPGTRRIIIDFDYDRDNRTVIDIGVRDPEGQRGWSGGNKSHIEIAEGDATPSYAPGRIRPGTWILVLGVPNIREGQNAPYSARISFSSDPGGPQARLPSGPQPVLSRKAGWYRGDFHMHTAHSDGACEINAVRAPCPAVETFIAARNAGLDFAAITDHNTLTQIADIRASQPEFGTTLLIPGTEVTTFFGHANALGLSRPVEFQLGSSRLERLEGLFSELEAQGAILSVNHPSLPSGEICMGCGWTVSRTDWSRVNAIEAVNGSSMRTGGPEGLTSGLPFWENILRGGYRVTAIGGSDNHDATDITGAKQPPVGTPATIVYASELSTRGIIAGVRSGRVFIDVAGLPEARLDMRAETAGGSAFMGGEIRVRPSESARITLDLAGAPKGARIEPVSHNLDVSGTSVPNVAMITLAAGARTGWFRVNVRDQNGRLLLVGNPIYVRAA